VSLSILAAAVGTKVSQGNRVLGEDDQCRR
jgi:hypothetical protein